MVSILEAYRLRWQRKRLRLRAQWQRRQLQAISLRYDPNRADQVLLFACLRDERIRLPYFLKYYRDLGVSHFFFVDNDSQDGSLSYLAEQKDVSIWSTKASYRDARFGMDWIMALLRCYGHKRWCLTVDIDEFLVYPFCESRPLQALTDWLDTSGVRSFSAMLVDMYPKGKIQDQHYREGQDPFAIAEWFDTGNYIVSRNPGLGNLWIQGGPRARSYFANQPKAAPALNKIPLVKWDRSYAYVSSTHMLLPRGLNLVYEEWGGEKASGCLLHAKFLDTFGAKAQEELARGEHYADSREYKAYLEGLEAQPELWCKLSEKYINWRQLEILGLMSKGNWA